MESSSASLASLARLVGSWNTEATHPAFPGGVVRGTVVVEWLEGERFLIHRARTDHPDFPSAISIIGDVARGRAEDAASGRLTMHYYDSRGVFREYEVSADETVWRMSRDDPGFAQRFVGTFTEDHTMVGRWQLSTDGVEWKDDLQITYRR